MINRHLAILSTVMWAVSAKAACVADGPLETARWIHSNERNFAFQQEGRNQSDRARFLSPTMYDLLQAEWKCQDVEDGFCALDSDPWLNAQDGEELQPIVFALASSNGTTATVRMSFRFGWSGVSKPRPVAMEAQLHLIKDMQSGCWLLDDLVGGERRSLKKQLQDYPHDA